MYPGSYEPFIEDGVRYYYVDAAKVLEAWANAYDGEVRPSWTGVVISGAIYGLEEFVKRFEFNRREQIASVEKQIANLKDTGISDGLSTQDQLLQHYTSTLESLKTDVPLVALSEWELSNIVDHLNTF